MISAFHLFEDDILPISLPKQFTFPFHYTPHPLSVIAAEKLQAHLQTKQHWNHDFGLDSNFQIIDKPTGMGKMFGVLVCRNSAGQLGYLWAFSGKIGDTNHIDGFVPPVFDRLETQGFFKKEEAVLNSYTSQIKLLQQATEYQDLKAQHKKDLAQAEKEITQQKERIKQLKIQRQKQREAIATSKPIAEVEALLFNLSEESKKENIILKKIKKYWKAQLDDIALQIKLYENKIDKLKQHRKRKSAELQQQLFKQYTFLNYYKETKDLGIIFENNPPAGAGECCAPKLLQYAYKNELTPIAMAEFWWGKSPSSQIRKHKQYYPACRSKCEPILQHMLNGLTLEVNTLEVETVNKTISVSYEDEYIAIIKKPAGLLSVPGKRLKHSVYSQLLELYPNATGPLIVHRLDRATSGLLVVAKDLPTYVALQKQFTEKTVQKKYVAILDGEITPIRGIVELPLRVDLDNRPQQLVCYQHGKIATTRYEVKKTFNNQTLIHFYPITGRTHQLRVHSAHHLGLNAPIVGDDLYGTPNDRMFLHAEELIFTHPHTQKRVQFEWASAFDL